MAPDSRSEEELVLVMGLEAFIKQSVGEGALLGKAIDSVAYLKVNPSVNMHVVV